MSEQEFELYLSLLSRFLRLKPEQRAEISDELRDHLEERLQDLTCRGLAHEEAVRRALDEFGDASELAAHFTSLAKRRRRRTIMRWTFGTIGVAAALLFVGVFMWNPNPADEGPPQANAQQAFQPDQPDQPTEVADGSFSPAPVNREAAVEEKLKQRIERISIDEWPLSKALEFISQSIEVDIVVNQQSLEEEGVSLDAPVTLELKHTPVSAATALELILERASGNVLTYQLRDGFLYVQSALAAEEDLKVGVYDVSDLLEGVEPIRRLVGCPPGSGAVSGFGGGGTGFFSVEEAFGQLASQMPAQVAAPAPAESLPLQNGCRCRVVEVSPEQVLSEVLQETTSGPWVETDGTGGTISQFGGLLVIRQTQAVHREIETILEMMRKAAAERSDDEAKVSLRGHSGPAWLGLGMHGGGDQGVPVKRVYTDSPAERAGLKQGDRILEVDGRRVSSVQEVVAFTGGIKPGKQVLVKVRRGEKTISTWLQPAPFPRWTPSHETNG